MRPATGRSHRRPRPPASRGRKRLPSASGTTSRAVTSASARRARTAPRVRGASPRSRRRAGSSALATNVPPGFSPSRISALASAIASTEAKNSRCAGGHEQDRRDVGLEGARERREVARLREAHLADHPRRRCAAGSSTDIGKPIWLFWLPGVFSTAKRRREDRRREVLRRGLAGRAGDRREAKAHLLLRRGAELSSAATGCGTMTAGKPAGSVRGRRSPSSAAAPARGGVAREVVAVHARPADRDEEIARPNLPRVHGDARERRRRPRRRAPAAAATSLERELHGRPASSAATFRSSNGNLRRSDAPASSRGPFRR